MGRWVNVLNVWVWSRIKLVILDFVNEFFIIDSIVLVSLFLFCLVLDGLVLLNIIFFLIIVEVWNFLNGVMRWINFIFMFIELL